jgi:hypothetical protein
LTFLISLLSAFALILLNQELGLAQGQREDWRALESGSIPGFTDLHRSLADAPLGSDERAEIYRLIDDYVRASFTNDEREKERAAILGMNVFFGEKAKDGSRQIVVQGTERFCSPVGNREMWIFLWQPGKIKLLFVAEGTGLMARNSHDEGSPDLVVTFHNTGFETSFTVLRWNKAEYKTVDCYIVRTDPAHPAAPKVIETCGKQL